jgi:mono/diheme cytochrome c family protein
MRSVSPLPRATTTGACMKTAGALLSLLALSLAAPAAEFKPEYNRDIRPILADNCFACHGPDSASRKAGLRLDRREDAVKAQAVIPGKPEASKLVARIHASDAKDVMPPPKTRKTLTTAQKDLLKAWIASGAEYQAHWSFIPPTRPELPKVKNEAWVRNPIDHFILAELEKRGLTPAPEADRRTLARRLSLDLTGLPPAPADVEAFVNDQAPDAYEKYVEKMLNSPHWGEHRGRFWLDAARYGDTHGIHIDNFREIWAYRDWVIKAFNQNKRFDEFTIEQLAGDLMPESTLDRLVATGFNRCNITTSEGGAINEEYLVLYTRDRTETTSAVWMGLTAGCAVCHDHKFDPITQRDFYSMAAFFNNTTQAAMDGNVQNTPPVIPVPKPEDRPRWEALNREIATLQQKLDARRNEARGDFTKWLATAKPEPKAGAIEGLTLRAGLDEGKGNDLSLTVAGKARKVKLDSGFAWVPGRGADKAFAIQPGASLEVPDAGDFDKGSKYSVSAWVKITKRGQNGAIVARMDNGNKFRGWDLWVQADKIGSHLISAWPDDAVKVVARNPLELNKWTHVVLSYDGSAKASGLKIFYNGVPQPTDVEADKLQGTTRTTVPLKVGQRHTDSRPTGVAVQDLRLFDRALNGVEAEQLGKSQRAAELLAKPADKRTAQETDELYNWWLVTEDKTYRDTDSRLAGARQEEAAIKSRGTIAHVMTERNTPPSAFLLYRGDYDKRRDPVKAETPKSLPPFPDDLPRNRLGFAKWLLQPQHPLTSRVTVNRFWQEVFGTGIVRTSGDFGIAGELPSHPELLDWLAVDFRDTGWDVKRFFKLLVMSATYRQAAVTTPEKLEKDRDNRLLSRGPRFRMDAEMVRDYALAASGLLVPKLGGPSVKPYQPPGVWEAVAMIGSNTRDYKQDKGENLYRRSMYTFWKRSAPPASMEIFNAPSRETCAVRRERTNTPLQALVTLNDVQFVEAARALAQSALKSGDKPEAQFDFMAKRLLSRPLRAEEQKILNDVLGELLAFYKANPEDAKQLIAVGESKADPSLDAPTLAAWTMVANQLLNLDEVLNK